jgi:hypothetical protein
VGHSCNCQKGVLAPTVLNSWPLASSLSVADATVKGLPMFLLMKEGLTAGLSTCLAIYGIAGLLYCCPQSTASI